MIKVTAERKDGKCTIETELVGEAVDLAIEAHRIIDSLPDELEASGVPKGLLNIIDELVRNGSITIMEEHDVKCN